MTSPEGRRSAEVWGSTWIPGPSPLAEFGDEAGYAIAWVRVTDGPMLQVVVDDTAAPLPGASGTVGAFAVGDESIDVFTPAAGGDA